MAKQESTLRPGDNGASSEEGSNFSVEPNHEANSDSASPTVDPALNTPRNQDGDALASPNGVSNIILTDNDLSDLAARSDALPGFQATSETGLQTGTLGGADVSIVMSFDARDGDTVSLPDISYIYDGDYVRQGTDLLLIKPDGTAVQIENYFAVEFTPDILGAGGRRLTPELVESFLHPVAPNQLAALTDNQVAQAQGNSIGTVETITGEVYAVRPDGTRVRLQAGDPVFQGDQIETADGASIKMTFIDGTLFTLGGDARLALDEMVFDPATSSGESAFSILQGGFLFVSGQIAQNNPNDMTVTTPVATIGIRGTIVTGEVSGEQLSTGETFRFTIVDGEIAITAGTQTIVLSENFATATGTADGTGGTAIFDFVDTAQNVIARNSSQFKALSPSDLQTIENAIKTTIEARTGQTIDLNLQDLVTNAPDSNSDDESDSEEDDDNSAGEVEDSGGDDEESPTNSETDESGGGEDSELTEEDLQDLQDAEETDEEGAGDDEEEQEEIGDIEGGEDPGDEGGGNDGTNALGDEVINVVSPYTGGSDDTEQTTGNDSQVTPNQTPSSTQSPVFSQDDSFNESVTPVTGSSSTVGDGNSSFNVTQGSLQSSPSSGFDFGYQAPNSTANTTFNSANFSNPDANYLVTTGSGTDNITTGGGNDSVNTGAGNDTITTGGGDDTVNAGTGDDTIIGGTGEGNDFYDGGEGYDSVTYDSVSGQNRTSLSVNLYSVSGTTSVNDYGAEIIDYDTLTNVDFIRLGHGDDTVRVYEAGIDVDGSQGQDTLSLNFAGGDVTFSFADGVFNKNSASSTFTNFEYVLGGEGNDKITVDDISQSASGGDGGSDTLVIGDNALLLNLGGSVSNVYLTDGEATQTFANFDFVEQTSGTLSLGNGTYNATGQVTLNTITLDNYIAPVFDGPGTFVNTGAIEFDYSAGADLIGNLDMRDGTFHLTGYSSQLDISDGGRLIIGTDTGYLGSTLSALSINVGSDGIVEIAEGETASLANAKYRFLNDTSTLQVNGTWLNSDSDTFNGFGASLNSSVINGTGTVINGGEISFNGDILNIDIQNENPSEEADGDIYVNNSGSFTVNSTITGGSITLFNDAQLNGTGSLADLSMLQLNDGAALAVTYTEVIGTVNLQGTSSVTGILDINEGTLAFEDSQATLSVGTNGTLIVGSETDLGSDGTLNIGSGGTISIEAGGRFDHVGGYSSGDDSQINQTALGNQSNPDIALLGNGNYAVVWEQAGNDKGAIVNASGTVIAEFDATATMGGTHSPRVAAAGTDHFIITYNQLNGSTVVQKWALFNNDGTYVDAYHELSNESGINYVDFDAFSFGSNGYGYITRSENTSSFTVKILNGGTTSPFTLIPGGPIVQGAQIVERTGGSLVAIFGTEISGDNKIYHQVLNPVGGSMGSQTFLDAPGAQGKLGIAALPSNGYVIAWSNGSEIFAQRFGSATQQVGSQISVTNGAIDGTDPSIVAFADGSFQIFYESATAAAIYMQSFNSSGIAEGDRVLIADTTNSSGAQTDVVAIPNESGDGVTFVYVSNGTNGTDIFFGNTADDVNGTALNLEVGSTIGGTGTYVVSDAETMDGITLAVGAHIDNDSTLTVGTTGLDIQGEVDNDGGTIVVSEGSALSVNGTNSIISDGVINVQSLSVLSGSGQISVDDLILNEESSLYLSDTQVNGTLSVLGEADIAGNLDITNAELYSEEERTKGDLDLVDGGVLIIGSNTSFDNFDNGGINFFSGGVLRIAAGESFDLGEFYEAGTSVFESQSGGTLEILGSATIGEYETFDGLAEAESTTINGSGNFSNAGSLTLSGDTVNIQFANLDTGTLQINSGTTTFNADMTSSGSIDINGTMAMNNTLTNTGTVSVDGTLMGNGRVINSNGTIYLGDGAEISVNYFDNSNGTIDFSEGDGTFTGGTLDMTTGTLAASSSTDSLTILEATAIFGGTTDLGETGVTEFSENGTLSVAYGETFTYDADSTEAQIHFLSGATIGGDGMYLSQGTLDVSGLTIGDNVTFNNQGQIDVGTLGLTLGSGTFYNNAGAIELNYGAMMTIAGGGTVTLDGSIGMNDGATIAGASTLDVFQLDGSLSSNAAGGTNVISVDLVVSESGSIVIGGDSGSDGTLLITGAFQNDGFVQVDPVNQNENGVLKISQDFTNFGTLQVDNAATLVVGDGLGTLTNEGTLQGQSSILFENGIIQAGRIINDGVLLVPGFTEVGSRLEIQGTRFDSLDGTITINNGGVLSFLSSTLTVGSDTEYNNSGSLVIGSGSVLDLGDDFQFENTNASKIILNSGASLGGAGTLLNYGDMDLGGVIIDATFENATTEGGVGSIDVASGETLTVHGSLTNSSYADFTVESGGVLAGSGSITNYAALEAAGVTIDSGLTYTGDIQLLSTADTFTVNGTVEGDLDIDLSQVIAEISGDGDFNVTGGTLNGFGEILQTSVTMRQSGILTLSSSDATISVQSHSWIMDSGAGFADNHGTLSFVSGASLGMADGVDFSYNATGMPEIQLGISGGQNEGNSAIFGDATFTVASGTLALSNEAVDIDSSGFIVNGVLRIEETDVSVSSSAFQTTANGTISVNSGLLETDNQWTNAGELSLIGVNASSVLTLTQDLTNSGSLTLYALEGPYGGTIEVSNDLSDATLVNTGVIETNLYGTATAQHLLQVNIDNQGTIDIQQDTRLGQSEAFELPTLDTKDGTVSISSGKDFLISGTMVVGADTNLNGSGTLTLGDQSSFQVVGGETFTIGNSGGTLSSALVNFQGQAFINGTGVLTNDAITSFETLEVSNGASLTNDGTMTGTDFAIDTEGEVTNSGLFELSGGSFSVAGSLANEGTISVDRGAVILNTSEFDNTNGTVTFSADSMGGSTLTINSAVTNAGKIVAYLSGTQMQGENVVVNSDNGSTFTNSGTFTVDQDPQSNPGSLIIGTDFNNSGLLEIDGVAEIQTGKNLDTHDGDIDFDFESEIVINGNATLSVGNDTSITGFGSLTFGDSAQLNIVSGEVFTITNNTSDMDFTAGGTISGDGDLEINDSSYFYAAGASVSLSTIENNGFLRIDNSTAELSVGTITGTGTTQLRSNSTASSTLSLTDDLTIDTNQTLRFYSSSFQSSLGGQVTGSGTLTNQGTISTDTAGTAHIFDVDIINTNLMDIAGQVDVQGTITLDSVNGTIKVSDTDNGPDGVINFLANSTLNVGDASVLTYDTGIGSSRGTIDFASGAVMSIADGETFTVDDDTVSLNFASGGHIGGTGTYKVAQDTDINMNGATFTTAALLNEGTIEVESAHGLRLNNSAVNNSQGLLDISARAAGVELDIGTDMTLDGDIRLSMISNGTIATQATLAVDSGSTLTLTGTLQSAKESGAGISNHTSGTIINQGMVDIDQTLTVADNFDTRDGQIDIASGQALNVDGTLTIGSDTALTGAGTISVGSTSLLDIASGETFTLTTLTPDLDFANSSTFGGAGTLRVNSDVSFDIGGFTLAPGEITNNGTITVDSASGTLGADTIGGTGSLAIITNSDFGATLVLSDDVTNASGHTIAFDASDGILAQGGTLTTVGNEKLTNNGVLQLDDAGGAHRLNLDIQNNGLIDLDGSATLTSGHHLDSVGGDISIATGHTLFADGTLTLGSGSTVSAAAAEIAGVGTLAISGGAVNLTNATLSTSNIDNDGTILVNNGDLTLASSNFDNAGGTIDFYSANTNSTIWFNTDFDNAGTIKVQANSESMLSGGSTNILTNSGLIAFRDGDKAGTNDGGGENQIKTISVVNTGTITQGVNDYLRIHQGASVNSVNGALLLAAGAVFDVNSGSTLFLGTNTDLTGTGTIELQDYATLSLGSGENFSYDSTDSRIVASSNAAISGAGTFTNQRDFDVTELTITSNFVNGESGTLNIGDLSSSTGTTITASSFTNQGELNIIGSNGVESSTNAYFDDFTNTGTINLISGTSGVSANITIGDQGAGTLTNDGLISVDGTDGSYRGGAYFDGNLVAGTSGGEIFIGAYNAASDEDFNPLQITGN
ncbi:MAG: hypothetical protein CMM78_08880, partial [Rhodospirillaceae bacterium]|nr:hypothetical protein [Rhodospirillaceae bacterium]